MLDFVLIDGFALMSYAAIVEVYRAANILADESLYGWRHLTLDGSPARASNGAMIVADGSLTMAGPADTVFLFAAGDPRGAGDHALRGWLRSAARHGVVLVGVSAAPYVLADAGLLEGHRATIHWDHRDIFEETFANVHHHEALYVIDRRRVTCAGGIAGMDLAIELIAREQGRDLAAKVGEWFIRAETRAADGPQRANLGTRHGTLNEKVVKVLAHMERHLEEPVSRQELATVAGVAVRQLERLFLAETGTTVARHYLNVRLERSAQLIRTTGLNLTSVAVTCGFLSCSHFSRAFRRHFGTTPSRLRADRRRSNTIGLGSGSEVRF